MLIGETTQLIHIPCSLQKHLLSIHTHCSSSNELAVLEMVTNSLYWVKVRKTLTLVTLFLFLLATFAFFHRNTFHKCKILMSYEIIKVIHLVSDYC